MIRFLADSDMLKESTVLPLDAAAEPAAAAREGLDCGVALPPPAPPPLPFGATFSN